MLSDPLVIVRAVHFAASMMAMGTIVIALLSPAPLRGLSLRSLALGALGVAAVSGALWLTLVASSILDVPFAGVFEDGVLASVALDTHFGRLAGLRLVLVLVTAALLLWRGPGWPALTAATALAASLAFSGHASAGTGVTGLIHMTSDVVHVVAAGLWLGALPALARLLWWSRAEPARRAMAVDTARRFGTLALIAVAAIVASGIVNTAILVGMPSDPLATAYGRALALKLALFAAMLALAAVNRFRLTPALPRPGASTALAGTAMAETGLGLGILLLVGFLGTQPSAAHVHSSSAAINREAAFVHIHTAEAMAELTINPGRAGATRATILLWHTDDRPYAADYVRLTLKLKNPGSTATIRDAERADDGTWAIDNLRIQSGGEWLAQIVIERNSKSYILDGTIVLAQCSNDC